MLPLVYLLLIPVVMFPSYNLHGGHEGNEEKETDVPLFALSFAASGCRLGYSRSSVRRN